MRQVSQFGSAILLPALVLMTLTSFTFSGCRTPHPTIQESSLERRSDWIRKAQDVNLESLLSSIDNLRQLAETGVSPFTIANGVVELVLRQKDRSVSEIMHIAALDGALSGQLIQYIGMHDSLLISTDENVTAFRDDIEPFLIHGSKVYMTYVHFVSYEEYYVEVRSFREIGTTWTMWSVPAVRIDESGEKVFYLSGEPYYHRYNAIIGDVKNYIEENYHELPWEPLPESPNIR